VKNSTARSGPSPRSWASDLTGAIALVEGTVAQRVFVAVEGLNLPAANVFGERVGAERGSDVPALVRGCAESASRGERVALVARAADLAPARGDLARIAALRLGLVVHAIAEPGSEGAPPSEAGIAPALALDDLPWGMLLAAGVQEAIDLALVARRAAEDSGRPFFVVHEHAVSHHMEPVAAPSAELCDAFLGRPSSGVRPVVGEESEQALAARVPFALASAMRELEALTARHHDVIERVPATDVAVALVGAGALGDSLLADVDRLRASGHDVGAVRVVAWRPFPGPRLVRALCRALAISVLEGTDRPLAHGGPLAVELKAAFADALTWAPEYPGVGRIPRIVAGVVAPRREIDAADLDALVHNLLADERGKRTFVIGGDAATALSVPQVALRAPAGFALRGFAPSREIAIAAARLSASVFGSLLGVRCRVAVRAFPEEEGGGVGFDLLAARERPRGIHAPHATRVVAIADPAALVRGNPLARLAAGGLLAVPTRQRSADALWAEVPSWAKAIVFDRRLRVVGWSPDTSGADPWVAAAAFVGIALAAASRDGSLADTFTADAAAVEREVAEAILVAAPSASAFGAAKDRPAAEQGGRIAREAFEAHLEVPGATIEREDDGVRLGRRDARVTAQR
jgi:pyruvate-ferredoxin/flavodoxin oxidoreductase